MAVFQCRNAVALSEIIEEKQQGEGGKRHHNASSEASLSKYSNEVKSKSPHSMGAMYIQLIPILFLRPLKTAVMWIIFAHLLGFFHFEVFSQFSDRGSVGTSFIILLQLLLSGFTTGVIASIASPIIALLSKWIIIGRYKAGEYPLWGSYYLRWWLVDQMLLLFDGGIFNSSDKTKILYWRLMGAKIAWNFKFDKSLMVREYDLITIESDCVVVDTLMRPFAVDPGLMILKPVTIMQGTTLNLKTSLAPGCIVAPNTVLPPMSSSYESSESSEKYKIFARTGPNPSFLSLLIVGYPIIFCYHLVGLLPWAVAIYWMVQFPFFASGLDIAFTSLTPFGQLLLHFKDLRRIGIHLLALLLNTLLAPFLKLALVVSIKRCVIGKFVAGQKRSSQWEVLRHWIMSELVRKGEFEGVYELLGRHYEGISAIYRALGAKIGKHVYWPGTPMNFYEFDLLEIGDDVVFGSRSKFMFSDAIESRHIKIEDGAMIADRCVVLPGVTVGKSCMIGSGSLLCKNGYYPPGSTWIGSKNGDAVLWDEGNVEAAEREPTLKPFGKAFYHKKATFTVFSQGFIFFYNMMFHAFSTVLWAMPAVVGIVLAGNYYDWIMAKTTEVEVIGHFYFIAGYTFCYYWVMIVSLAIPIAAKRFIMGDLIPGDYDWDKSDYCQRWQISITMQKIASDFINDIRGSAFIVMYFQTLGCTIGERVCLYPNGGDPMLTEPDLVSIGDHTVVDKASIVAHINSKGKFSLNELRIGNNCALRSDSRLLSGAEMCDNSRLLEHTLVLGGDIIESGKVMQGWPANELQ
ncbi:hypothetical protein BC830DRAFT_795380 [Chytriomyces sp. MP71]|nr:hypothetical protein BC830DRAFT_795380 [Chytriomyces sp. MP71]